MTDADLFPIVVHMVTSSDDPIRTGATIKALRGAYGWKQIRLAEAVKTSRSHLSNIESGRKACTPDLARKIADVLGIPLAAITTDYSVKEIGA